MTRKRLLATSVAAIALLPVGLAGTPTASAQSALTLYDFSVLGASTVTNTGPTFLSGDIGVFPGLAITDDGVGGGLTIGGARHEGDAVAELAQNELASIIDNPIPSIWGAAPPPTVTLGAELSNQIIGSGIYDFTSSAQLTGSMTLDGAGDPDALFIFIVDSDLTTLSGSSVLLTGGARGSNVYWVVGSSATLGTGSTFAGRILARQSITLTTGVTISCGAAWADVAAVTLDTNVINSLCAFTAVGDVVGDDGTPTQEEIADVIDDYVEDGGELPESFQDLLDILDDLTPEQIEDVFSQLAGETSSGVAPTATQSMNSFLSTVLNSGTAPGTERSGPKVATVKALGYAGAAPLSPAGSAVSSFGESSTALELNTFDIWAAVYGSNTNADGDSSDGTHDRSSSVFGIAGGVDFNVDHDTRVGIALSGGTTAFDLSDHLGDGDSNVFQTAIYARQEFDAVYILGALAYGYHDVSTDRTITLPSPSTFTEDLSADFSAHDIAAQIEAGYRMGWFTPYGAVRVQSIYTPSYSEKSNSPVDGFALDYDANTATNVRTEIGARMEQIFELQDGANLAFRSRIAWAHDFWYGQDGRARFQSLPGSESFAVRGTSGAEDSLVLSAGAEFGFGNGLALAGWFDGELAEDSETYGGNVRISYGW